MTSIVKIYADSRFPVDRALVKKTVAQTLEEQAVTGKVSVEITVCGNRKIKALNKKFRNIDQATDVLSFPLHRKPSPDWNQPDDIFRLGDITVNWPHARRVAVKSNQLISVVICDLVKHGLLHLLGQHHR